MVQTEERSRACPEWSGIIVTLSVGRTVIPNGVPGLESQRGDHAMSYSVRLEGSGRNQARNLDRPQPNRARILSKVDRRYIGPCVTSEWTGGWRRTLDFLDARRAAR